MFPRYHIWKVILSAGSNLQPHTGVFVIRRERADVQCFLTITVFHMSVIIESGLLDIYFNTAMHIRVIVDIYVCVCILVLLSQHQITISGSASVSMETVWITCLFTINIVSDTICPSVFI